MGRFRLGFSTLDKETAIDRLPVRGKAPSWLSGTLIRNGPAKFEVGGKSLRHWFDGFAMLHAFSFSDGQVSYANRFLESRAYRYAKEEGRLGFFEFATDPCRALFKRLTTVFWPSFTDNASVNISRLADRFVALTELPLPVAFDPKTLKTSGIVDYEDTLRGHFTTAHPHYDHALGEGINYLTRLSVASSYNAYRIARGARRELIGSIKTQEPSYMHSFAMTPRYLIFAAFPFVVRPLDLLLAGRPFIDNFQWRPERGTVFHVLSRDTGRLAGTFSDEPFFAFHHVNAFEQGENILLDIAAYPDARIVQEAFLDVLRGDPQRITAVSTGQFRRYKIPLSGSSVEREILSENPLELPRINYRSFNGRDYRFAYGVSGSRTAPYDFFDRLVKIDVQKRASLSWSEDGCYPGEPVFVASPSAHREDEGVVLSVVLNANKANSFLLMLDAGSYQELARAEVPHHIPFGFHGQFFEAIG